MFSLEECVKLRYEGLIIYVPDNVYCPAEDTFLLAKYLDVNSQDIVLDMGTGCGLLAILAAKKALMVFAVDLNPSATRCTLINGKLNGVKENLRVVCGDLFKPFRHGIKFDLIMFNAPYLPLNRFINRKKAPHGIEWLEAAWSGGKEGRELLNVFIEEVPSRIKRGGRVLIVQSTLSRIEKTVYQLESAGFKVRIVDEEPSFFEKIVLIRAEK
ncbi:TPA: methyltransferase [Candidatus Bathyarchaeota archaeon]|nr:methyltransferase [Candidatus Bathyarchaeota archaeon]